MTLRAVPDFDPEPTTPDAAVEASRKAYQEARAAYMKFLPLVHAPSLVGFLGGERINPAIARMKRDDAQALARAAQDFADAATRVHDELWRPIREGRP